MVHLITYNFNTNDQIPVGANVYAIVLRTDVDIDNLSEKNRLVQFVLANHDTPEFRHIVSTMERHDTIPDTYTVTFLQSLNTTTETNSKEDINELNTYYSYAIIDNKNTMIINKTAIHVHPLHA